MSDTYKSKAIRKTSTPNTLINIHVLNNREEIMGFINNFQNIKYQIKVDVKLQYIKPLSKDDQGSASDGHTDNEYITIKLLTDQNRLLGNENLTTAKIVGAIYEFP